MTELDRDAIVDTALELFISHGYATTTLSDIAAAGGVDPDVLAFMFPDNQSFVLAVVDAMHAAVFDELATMAEAADLVHALRDAHQAVLSRTVTGDGPVSLYRMQQMGFIAMTYPVVAQIISAHRKKKLVCALAELGGVGEDDPEIKRVVTVWSAVVTATYAAGINDNVMAIPQSDWIETDRVRSRLNRTFTQVTGKETAD